ncbi:IspD/TarI family cytidylyltransferase [Flindersiella endophytica]
MTTAAIVPAAGRGERLGRGIPKALRPLGGAPMLVHAIRALAWSRSVDHVVVALPADQTAEVERQLADYEWSIDVRVVAGGDDRRTSVAAALAALPAAADVVIVHDAARPLAPPELIDAVASRIRNGAVACIPVIPLADTVKQVTTDTVVRTIDRTELRAVQTPQGFRRSALEQAHAWADTAPALELAAVTDDAGLIERLGLPVCVVPGVEEAFKVTRPLDLVLAEAVLARRRADGAR